MHFIFGINKICTMFCSSLHASDSFAINLLLVLLLSCQYGSCAGEGLIRSPRVVEALLDVDRAYYINNDFASEVEAYQVTVTHAAAAALSKYIGYSYSAHRHTAAAEAAGSALTNLTGHLSCAYS